MSSILLWQQMRGASYSENCLSWNREHFHCKEFHQPKLLLQSRVPAWLRHPKNGGQVSSETNKVNMVNFETSVNLDILDITEPVRFYKIFSLRLLFWMFNGITFINMHDQKLIMHIVYSIRGWIADEPWWHSVVNNHALPLLVSYLFNIVRRCNQILVYKNI